MVNYGSNLIPRCFTSSNRKLEDTIILGVLLRQTVAMFDAIDVMLSHAAVYPCYLQIRAIFEASLYLEWMMKEDTENKAKYFYVANLRQERVWANRTQRGLVENIAFENIMKPLGDTIPETTDRISSEGLEYLQEINRVLAQPSFADIDHAFDSYRKNKKFKYDPDWYKPYNPSGPQSVRALAGELERLHEYELIYVLSSEVIHSNSQKHHIKFLNGRVEFTPIRYLEGIDNVISFGIGIILKIYVNILNYYRPDELPNFSKKYVENWRPKFMNIPGVTYIKEATAQQSFEKQQYNQKLIIIS